MARKSFADTADAGTPISMEVALRRVRLVAGVLILVRLLTTNTLPPLLSVLLVCGFWLVNVISYVAQRESARHRAVLGVVQLLADTVVVLLVVWAQHGRASTEPADWALLVLPVIEGAIRFQIRGAIASWAIIAVGYAGWNRTNEPRLPMETIAGRLTVVFLVALPVGFLAGELVKEISAHRRGRAEAERRSAMLRAAAMGGQKSTRLHVDEILDVLRNTVGEMGFADPQVFELCGSELGTLTARPVRQSRDVLAIPPGDPRLLAAAAARDRGQPTVWFSPAGNESVSMLLAVPVTTVDDALVVVTARWPGPGSPPESQTESLELFAAQAGASLRNAQVHRELQELKDRLEHQALHDPLTELPNRRRFIEQLERMCTSGRPGDLISLLFLDLDGFKEVNDRYGHDVGNDLLVAVAARLRSCVRPGDIVARMGGDEFTIMLNRLETVAPAVEVAERLVRMFNEPFDIRSHAIRTSTSIGIALAFADEADPGDLLRRADVAMYRAKSHGKAGWAMDPSSLERAGNGTTDS